MNVADICPVGALTTKDFRFKIRVWFLEDVQGVCTGCANGCNVHLGVANNQVYRYVPRRNDAVNETWMCDEGRLSYKRIGATRPPPRGAAARRWTAGSARFRSTPRSTRRPRGSGARSTANGPGAVVALASPHATNEDLFTLRRFLEALGSGAHGGCSGGDRPRGHAPDQGREGRERRRRARARLRRAPRRCSTASAAASARVLIALGHDVLDAAARRERGAVPRARHADPARLAPLRARARGARGAARARGCREAAARSRTTPAACSASSRRSSRRTSALAEGEVLTRLGQRARPRGLRAGRRWSPREVSQAHRRSGARLRGHRPRLGRRRGAAARGRREAARRRSLG